MFTVSAANSEGSADKAITVTVLDAEYLLIHDSGAIGAETTEADLTAKGAQLSKSGGGSFAYDEKGVYIATSATSGSIWYDVAFPSSFDQSRDILTAELKFSVPAGLGQMINLFFISDASGNPVTCFAVDGAYKFVYSIESGNWTAFVHNGSQVIIEMDAEYTLKAICDFGAKKSYALLYKGEELVCAGTPFVFRTPNTTAAVFKSGIDNKSDVMYYLKSFVIMNDNRTYLVAASSGSAMIDEQNPTVSKDLAGYLLGVNGFTDKCTFTCDKTEGVTVDGDIATFSAEGDYLFTASCPTSAGLKTVSFTVSVKNYKPITMMWQDDFDAKPTDPSVTVTDNVVFTEADGRTVAQFNVDTDGAHTIMYYQEAEMTGTIVSEVTFMETKQTDNKYLMLTAFYKGKDTKTPVLTIGSANGYLKYNWYNPASKNDNKQEWTDLKVEGSSIRFATGQWYTLKVYTDLVNDKCYYFLSGDTITMRKEKVNYTVSVGTDKYLGESPFRNAANKPAHSVAVFCNDAVVHGNIDSVKLYKANAPIIEAPAALTVMGTSVDLAAYCFNADSSNITCNDASVGITGRVATFAKAGTYIFTVSAANEFATVTKEITVTVKDSDKTAVYNKNFVAEDFDLAAELALEGGMLKETNGTLTKDENGILIATTAEKKSPYADFDLSSLPTTGRIDIEIGFMIPTDNNQQINFGFLNDRNGGKNVACFLIRSSDDNILAHEGIDNGWFSMAYNGSNVRISKGHKYLMKLEIDLDKHFYYVFIKDEEGNTLGTGTDGYVALGKIVCRGLKAVPGVMKFGFDNKNAGAKLYLRSMNIQTLTEKTL